MTWQALKTSKQKITPLKSAETLNAYRNRKNIYIRGKEATSNMLPNSLCIKTPHFLSFFNRWNIENKEETQSKSCNASKSPYAYNRTTN